MLKNNHKPINESYDPRFGKTSPKDSIFRDVARRINSQEGTETNNTSSVNVGNTNNTNKNNQGLK